MKRILVILSLRLPASLALDHTRGQDWREDEDLSFVSVAHTRGPIGGARGVDSTTLTGGSSDTVAKQVAITYGADDMYYNHVSCRRRVLVLRLKK